MKMKKLMNEVSFHSSSIFNINFAAIQLSKQHLNIRKEFHIEFFSIHYAEFKSTTLFIICFTVINLLNVVIYTLVRMYCFISYF